MWSALWSAVALLFSSDVVAARHRIDDCHHRHGMSPDMAGLWRELDSGAYSVALYGEPYKMPKCSQLRLLWLPLIPNETLHTITVCANVYRVPDPIPPRTIYLPPGGYLSGASRANHPGSAALIDGVRR